MTAEYLRGHRDGYAEALCFVSGAALSMERSSDPAAREAAKHVRQIIKLARERARRGEVAA